MSLDPQKPIRLRKDRDTVDHYLDSLDRASHHPHSHDERQSERLAYRIPTIEVEFQSHDGNRTRFLLPTRNICRDGVSLLAGAYLHTGTSCRLHLVCTHRGVYPTTGRVVRCRYIVGSGNLHEVGIRFDYPLDVALFSDSPKRARVVLMSRNPDLHSVVNAACPVDRVTVVCADGLSDLMTIVADEMPHAILLDMQASDGWAAIKELRDHQCAVIALTSASGTKAQQRYLDAGCQRCLTTPVKREQLIEALGLMLEEPITSRFADNPDMSAAITDFVDSLAHQVSELGQALQSSNTAAFSGAINKLKRQAARCGFDVIADVAQRLEAGLMGGGAVDSLQKQLGELARHCSGARGPSNTNP